MRAAVLYGVRDLRFEERPDPAIVEPSDALVRVAAACVCGSDLMNYRGIAPVTQPTPAGHEYCGVVEDVGSAVRSVRPGQFVVGAFYASDNTCANCRAGFQSACERAVFIQGAQAPMLRVPLADGTLIATGETPSRDMLGNVVAISDVMCTAWFGAEAAKVAPGMTVAVVGDGAVGLLAVLSAKVRGAERILAMSRHGSRQKLAREFGATDVVSERGDEGVNRIKELTGGLGADAVIECVGTRESLRQAIRSTRQGGNLGYVGWPHGVELDAEELYFSHAHVHGGAAPVRRFMPQLLAMVRRGEIQPGKVFDLTLPLDRVADGYRAMDERRAIKALLIP